MMFISFLIVGIVSGWLAGSIVKGRGFGCFGNLVVGIIGAMIGGYIFRILNIYVGGFLGHIAMSVVGAVLFLFVVGLVKNK